MYGNEEMARAYEHYGDVVVRALRVDEQESFGHNHEEEVERLLNQLADVPHEQAVKAVATYANLARMRAADTSRAIGL